MTALVQEISLWGVAWGFLPAVIVIGILVRWGLSAKTSVYALARMLLQLLLIGYVLTFIFTARHAGIIVLVLAVMLLAASWIALYPVRRKQPHLYLKALVAITAAGVPILALVSQVILDLHPWFLPRYVVPLAGMIFASSMTTISLAAERFEAERDRGSPDIEARHVALQTSLIPIINSLFATGLVSLPGMMTGQILSGVSPLIAVKYQIVVMCMIFGATGLSAAIYLYLARERSARQGRAEQTPP